MRKWFILTLSFMSLLLFNFLNAESTMTNLKNKHIVFETNQGNIEITLMPEVAPKACENMLTLIKKGYYNGITFHRVIEGFMVQCGDPTGTGAGGGSCWGKDFQDEFSNEAVFDKPGILAMANRGPNTNGSQFFITTAPTTWLNHKHTIFGLVTKGYDVVQKIEKSKTDGQDRPKETQKIIKAYIKE